MARSLFPLDQEKLNEALEARELALQSQGFDPKVASAYLTVAPLLWEKDALATYSRDHPGLSDSLPEVVSPAEATSLATQEYSLTASQQQTLNGLLTRPPT
jgi:hypothetical protein